MQRDILDSSNLTQDSNELYSDPSLLIFANSDSLLWQNDYDGAISSFETISKNNNSSTLQKAYAYKQMISAFFAKKDTTSAKLWMSEFDKLGSILSDPPPWFSASSLHNHGRLSFWREEEKRANALLDSAQLIYDKATPVNHFRKGAFFFDLHKSFELHKSSARADDLLELAFKELNVVKGFFPLKLKVLYERSRLDIEKKTFEVGLTRITTALQYLEAKQQTNSIFYAKCLSRKGRLLMLSGRRVEAEEAHNKAYLLWRNCCPSDRTGLAIAEGLAFFYFQSFPAEKLDLDKINSIIDAIETTFGNDRLGVISTLRIQAQLYYVTKRFSECIDVNQKLLDDSLKSYLKDVNIDQAYFQLIDSYAGIGKFDASRSYGIKQLQLYTSLKDAELGWEDIYIETIRNKWSSFITYYQLGKTSLANFLADKNDKKLLEEAVQLFHISDSIAKMRLEEASDNQISNVLTLIDTLYNEGMSVTTAYWRYQQSQGQKELDWANKLIEGTKANILYRDVLLHKADYISKDLLKKERSLKAEIADLIKSNSPELPKKEEELQNLMSHIKQEYPTYYEALQKDNLPSIESILGELRNNKSCIFQLYSSKEDEFILFIHPDTTLFKKVAITDELKDALAVVKSELYKDILVDKAKFLIASNLIYKSFVLPFEEWMDGTEKISIIPSLRTNFLPFETLVTNAAANNWDYKDFLTYKYVVDYSHSYKNYLEKIKNDFSFDRSTKLLAFAFGVEERLDTVRSRGGLGSLPFSISELDSIEKQLGKRRIKPFLGKKATKQNFLVELQKQHYNIVHLAMHAESSERNRFDNKIYFRTNQAHQYDTLYGYQLIPIELTCDLVVLSSCKTASGALKAGEGTYSLTRSFMQAGADRVISSLWKIDDTLTAEIMDIFYEKINEGRSPEHALHLAKLEYLKSAQKRVDLNPSNWGLLLCF